MRSSSRQTCCVVCQGPKPVERWLLEMLDGIAPAGFLVETRRNVLFISSAGLAQQLSLSRVHSLLLLLLLLRLCISFLFFRPPRRRCTSQSSLASSTSKYFQTIFCFICCSMSIDCSSSSSNSFFQSTQQHRPIQADCWRQKTRERPERERKAS